MKVEYLPSFIKDLRSLEGSSAYARIRVLAFDDIPACESLDNIRNIKKLKAEDNAYRIRVGNYRIGFFLENETIIFARVRHRKDIYQVFP